MGDDVDCLRLSWSHKKVDLEVDPVGSFARSGGEQSQHEYVMKSASDTLAFWYQAGRRNDIAVVESAGNNRMDLETGSFRLFGNIDQDPIFDCNRSGDQFFAA